VIVFAVTFTSVSTRKKLPALAAMNSATRA